MGIRASKGLEEAGKAADRRDNSASSASFRSVSPRSCLSQLACCAGGGVRSPSRTSRPRTDASLDSHTTPAT